MVKDIKIADGYKQTEVEIIPVDWEIKRLGNISNIQRGASPRPIDSPLWFSANSSIGWLRISDISKSNKYLYKTVQSLSKKGIEHSRYVENNNLIMSICATVGKPIILKKDVCIHDGFVVFRNLSIEKEYLYYILEKIEKDWGKSGQTGSQMNLNTNLINSTPIPLPPTREEQIAIATALSDMDALIEGLEKLLVKKRNIKQGAMQDLLKPKDGWTQKTLKEVIDCLDNLRIPLNEKQRLQMTGDFPYCGANGIVGYVDDYVIDDEIILIAEDGGYFDEYSTRPIAYKITGKCWVNNHAHILKAKSIIDQDFLFYSLVNKNIMAHIASGTRAKLNKSELYKIRIDIPNSTPEQSRIANILTDIDTEIFQLEIELSKYKELKTGMMQELLTGKKRLI